MIPLLEEVEQSGTDTIYIKQIKAVLNFLRDICCSQRILVPILHNINCIYTTSTIDLHNF